MLKGFYITSGMLRAEESTVYQELIMFEKNKTKGSTGQLGREEDEFILLSPPCLASIIVSSSCVRLEIENKKIRKDGKSRKDFFATALKF
jgi:hypothetical protein